MIREKCETCQYFIFPEKGEESEVGACQVHAPKPMVLPGEPSDRVKKGDSYRSHYVSWPVVYKWQGCKEWKEA